MCVCASQDPESDVEIDIDLDPEEAERRQVEEARRRRAELAAKLAQDKAHTGQYGPLDYASDSCAHMRLHGDWTRTPLCSAMCLLTDQ